MFSRGKRAYSADRRHCCSTKGEWIMSIRDKSDAAKDKLAGKAEETVGRLTDDKGKIVEGKAKQVRGGVKDTVADAKAHLRDSMPEDDGAARGENDTI